MLARFLEAIFMHKPEPIEDPLMGVLLPSIDDYS